MAGSVLAQEQRGISSTLKRILIVENIRLNWPSKWFLRNVAVASAVLSGKCTDRRECAEAAHAAPNMSDEFRASYLQRLLQESEIKGTFISKIEFET
jgi:hypothetical protein